MAAKSIEPKIAELGNGWLKKYNLDYKLEQEELNPEVDNALEKYFTKSGGQGGNRPDAKMIKQDSALDYYPILIEYKGYKGKLEKLDENQNVANTIKNGKNKGMPNFANISDFAVNGAVHYANALLEYTSYANVIAIGMTGHINEFKEIDYEIGVYFVSKDSYGLGTKVGIFTDFSFLAVEHFDDFINKIKQLKMDDNTLKSIKLQRENEIEDSLKSLNKSFYNREENISPTNRIHIVSASVMSTLGIPNKVAPLEVTELKSSQEKDGTDGDIIIRKVTSFLSHKNVPPNKQAQIINSLKTTLLEDNLNIAKNGRSALVELFGNVVDKLGQYYKVGLDTDFTGKLFNVMYSWLDFADDDKNDVVLTPTFISALLAKLARVNKDSYVWDLAMGSGGLLVSAMNLMLDDAKSKIKSPEELKDKEVEIMTSQILGVEVRPDIYMLAVLNMILMGDGSSNIIEGNSLTNFDGKYLYKNEAKKFPADAFILNPPYSAAGNGMVFVEKALSMMTSGYAAIIIQSSAGSGKAEEYNKRILTKNRLVASIKMPLDLFIGKSNVPTRIYVFCVGEKHEKDDLVRFIDFTNDGYSRTNRLKAKASTNLKDTDNAKSRYQEVVELVRFGARKLNYFSENEFYEDTINPESGKDWNKAIPQNTILDYADYYNNYTAYSLWKTQGYYRKEMIDSLNSGNFNSLFRFNKTDSFPMRELFEVINNSHINTPKDISEIGNTPYFTRTTENNGLRGYTNLTYKDKINPGKSIAVGLMANVFFYMDSDFYAGQFTKRLKPKFSINELIALYFITFLNKNNWVFDPSNTASFDQRFYDLKITLPITKDGKPNYNIIENEMKKIHIAYANIIYEHLKTLNPNLKIL